MRGTPSIVGQDQVFSHRSGELLFHLAGVPPVANLQIAANILLGNTRKHVVVAG